MFLTSIQVLALAGTTYKGASQGPYEGEKGTYLKKWFGGADSHGPRERHKAGYNGATWNVSGVSANSRVVCVECVRCVPVNVESWTHWEERDEERVPHPNACAPLLCFIL